MDQQTYRKLISGRSAGLAAGLLRCVLRIAAVGYGLGVGVRNLLYSRGWLKAHRVNAAVIAEGKHVTYDLKEKRDDPTAVGTSEMADAIIERL